MGPKRLILFDIDGTLLHGGYLFRDCFEGAFRDCFPGVELRSVSFSGKTDPQICHELLGQVPPAAEVDTPAGGMTQEVRKVIDEYLNRVEKCLPDRAHEVEILPGTHSLLERLASVSDCRLGLLTGNVRRGAALKLSTARMEKYFEFGAFGDDHWNRYCLPTIAAERAEKQFGERYAGKEIVVIGDTVHDVNCGKSIGVRSIAVGTGARINRADLLAAEPDHFFEDLSDTESVVDAILRI